MENDIKKIKNGRRPQFLAYLTTKTSKTNGFDTIEIDLVFFLFFIDNVNCGSHSASSCADCPMDNGEDWCNGDCVWMNQQCVPVGKNNE